MKRILTLAYAVLAYGLFLASFLYAIAFVGNLGVPQSIDNGRTTPLLTALLINALLLGAFAIQHSVMARRWFKERWTRIASRPVERSTYVLSASLLLALLEWQWRPITTVVWDLRGTAAELPLTALSWMGWATVLVSTFLINHFELFGLAQAWEYFQGRESRALEFKTPGLYRLVRHPIYLGFALAFWAAPVMTAGHLFFSVMTSGYLLVGIFFEERDLIRAYGESYREYRRRVPMLIPLLKSRRAAKAEAAKSGA